MACRYRNLDERVAARYNESAAEMFDPAVVEPLVDVVADLAGSGRALELGTGTGRIAPRSRSGSTGARDRAATPETVALNKLHF